MALPLSLPSVDQLPRTPATEVKTQGWRGLMRAVGRSGKLVVTHHDTPEAVVLSVVEYDAIAAALQAAADRGDPALDALRRSFDDRLAALEAPDAGARLRGLMGVAGARRAADGAPARSLHLGGTVIAGAGSAGSAAGSPGATPAGPVRRAG